MKKELKKSIYETVKNLRNLRFILKDNLNLRTSETSQLRNEIKELKKELESHRNPQTTRYVSPSTGSFPEL
jgi:ribosomal protein L29